MLIDILNHLREDPQGSVLPLLLASVVLVLLWFRKPKL